MPLIGLTEGKSLTSTSIGIARTGEETDGDKLIEAADKAMHIALSRVSVITKKNQ